MCARRVTIVFEPEGRRTLSLPRKSILEAANEVGIGIRSECGGYGVCGKCKVIVSSKTGLNSITDAEKKHLAAKEIRKGYRLACRSLINGRSACIDVLVPEEHKVERRRILTKAFAREVRPDPLVRKLFVKVSKPSLEDVRGDAERLLESLGEGYQQLKIDISLLRKLPGMLREADWKVTVTIWNRQKIISVEKGKVPEIYGIAIDIGTSKIIGYLTDLKNGKTVGLATIENPQMIYGEDVISRISLTIDKKEKLRDLHTTLIAGVNRVIKETCDAALVDLNRIYEAAVVGNTAMHHFFLDIPTKNLALYPYVPAVRTPMNVKPERLNVEINPSGNVYVLPVIAGFIGADAVGDIVATGIHLSPRTQLLIDIGTNTEVVLGNRHWLAACSCASGPAFEGMQIKHGMKAVSGAIERVQIDSFSHKVKYRTIDDTKPVGICGSAMIDILAELWKARAVDFRGKLQNQHGNPRYRKVNNTSEFVVAWKEETATEGDIVITQEDVREIQLAKAAIHTGCAVLMKRRNVVESQIDKVLVAGSFGNYIDPVKAKIVGLIPDVPTENIKFVGNTAGLGAKMALISRKMRKEAEQVSKKVEYLELAADSDFKTEFAYSTYIPHRDIDRFPTAKKYA